LLDKLLSKSKLKELFEDFVEHKIFGKISANQLTLLGLLFGLLSALTLYATTILPFWIELTIFSLILMIISFILDAIDGIIARFGKPTTFGGILDLFCDRTVEIFIIIALVSTDPEILIWPGLFSLGAMVICITMFLAVGGIIKSEDPKKTDKIVYYRAGLMERSETLLFFIFMIAFYWLRAILLWVFGILVFLTALIRLKDAYNLFYEKKKNI